MANDTTTNRRAVAKCSTCGPVTVPFGTAAAEGWSLRCPGCHRWLCFTSVTAKKGTRKCGAWCTDGFGRSCTCECEGRNHGIAYAHTGALWASR